MFRYSLKTGLNFILEGHFTILVSFTRIQIQNNLASQNIKKNHQSTIVSICDWHSLVRHLIKYLYGELFICFEGFAGNFVDW